MNKTMRENSKDDKGSKERKGGEGKILEAAFELFAQKGYVQTSVDSIAKKAGISKGLIYHYFKSKEDILKGLFRDLMKESTVFYQQTGALSSKQQLNNIIDSSVLVITRHAKVFRFIWALTVQPQVVKGLKSEIERAKNEWLGMLAQLFEDLGYENPKTEAYLLVALLDGMGLGKAVLGKDYPAGELKELIKKRYNLGS